MRFWLVFAVLLIKEVLCHAPRLEGSPYPVSVDTPTTLFLVDDAQFNLSQTIVVEALQGILAKDTPQIFRIPDGNSGAALWLSDLLKKNLITQDSTFLHDFEGLVQHFSKFISGYVLYAADSDSVNVAISVSAVQNAIPVTSELVKFAESLGLSQLFDVSGLNSTWFVQKFGDSVNKQIVSYQHYQKASCLADYAVFAGAITFFDAINSSLVSSVFDNMKENSALFGWGDNEIEMVTRASQSSIMSQASDWAINLSTLTNFEANLTQRTHSNATRNYASHTVCFLFTDGDNIQWVLNTFATDERWFGSPQRGETNLGWTLSPALAELAPTVMDYLYENAANLSTGKDFFVSGVSGLGYVYPQFYEGMDSYATLNSEFLKKGDLSIVNVLNVDYSVESVAPLLAQDNIDAIFYYLYWDYSGLHGQITWENNKPIIGGRYNLWQGFETPASLAAKLNSLSVDIWSSEAYSLIPVHAWSMNVSAVIECTKLLEDWVRVVTPEEFVQLIQENLKPD